MSRGGGAGSPLPGVGVWGGDLAYPSSGDRGEGPLRGAPGMETPPCRELSNHTPLAFPPPCPHLACSCVLGSLPKVAPGTEVLAQMLLLGLGRVVGLPLSGVLNSLASLVERGR